MSVPAGFHSLPLPIVQLSLASVLKCGQSFRWVSLPLPVSVDDSGTSSRSTQEVNPCFRHEYRLCLQDRVVCLRQSTDTLFYRAYFPEPHATPAIEHAKSGETLTWLKDYFQLHIDLVKLYDRWSERDAVFKGLRERFGGIRMLRQDPWENLISFICSSNNNISRITGMVQNLCRQCSPPLLSLPDPGCESDPNAEPRAYHPFPPPSVLATPGISTVLRELGFGYRADFIQKTATMLVSAQGSFVHPEKMREAGEIWLEGLRKVSTEEAREDLLKFMGVGRKVADCVLLMSLDKKEVIPVDTHVHQIAVKHYGLKGSPRGKAATMNPKLYADVNTKLGDIWGEYAGWAHSVLFTADLKAFSTYGLPEISGVEADPIKPSLKRSRSMPLPGAKPELVSKKKPRRSDQGLLALTESESLITEGSLSTSLAERVKERRRSSRSRP